MSTEPLVVIPARLASSRLPGKPLKKIGNKTLIEHCVDSARKAGVDPHVITDSDDVFFKLFDCGYAELDICMIGTDDIETGTDRVAMYVQDSVGWDNAPDWIINVQGDMPFGTAPFIRMLIDSIRLWPKADMITPIYRAEIVNDNEEWGDFQREIVFQHVGMYAYKKDALRRFYEARNDETLRGSEKDRRLEQCRAVALGMDIITSVVTDHLPPLEVNTQADLDRINEIVNACAGFGNPGFTADEAASLALAGGG